MCSNSREHLVRTSSLPARSGTLSLWNGGGSRYLGTRNWYSDWPRCVVRRVNPVWCGFDPHPRRVMNPEDIVCGECIISLLPFYINTDADSLVPVGDIWIIYCIEDDGFGPPLIQLAHMSGRYSWFYQGNILRDFKLMGDNNED